MVLIFDGNYLFYKSLFVFSSYGSKGKLLEDKKDQAMFMRKIATDLAYAIRQFGNPDQIVFTVDSRSWRKDIAIQEGSYKGDRTKDESKVNWDNFYKCMNDFTELLSTKGFIISKQEKAEGDDLMALWSMALNENKMDAVIVTGDRDLTQSINLTDSGNFTVVYNPNTKTRKIVTPKGFDKWLNAENVDIFNADSYMNRGKDLIQDALNSIGIEEIDPFYTVFEKIITGDAGDSVPPVFTWEKDKKTYRITPVKCLRMWEILNAVTPITDIMELPSRAAEICSAISAITKHNPPTDLIKHNLERNTQLVFLDHRIIPESIQSEFNEKFSEMLKLKKLPSKIYDMHNILEGTNYISETKTFEADIFKAYGK